MPKKVDNKQILPPLSTIMLWANKQEQTGSPLKWRWFGIVPPNHRKIASVLQVFALLNTHIRYLCAENSAYLTCLECPTPGVMLCRWMAKRETKSHKCVFYGGHCQKENHTNQVQRMLLPRAALILHRQECMCQGTSGIWQPHTS